jgi:hypothetical protein
MEEGRERDGRVADAGIRELGQEIIRICLKGME